MAGARAGRTGGAARSQRRSRQVARGQMDFDAKNFRGIPSVARSEVLITEGDWLDLSGIIFHQSRRATSRAAPGGSRSAGGHFL